MNTPGPASYIFGIDWEFLVREKDTGKIVHPKVPEEWKPCIYKTIANGVGRDGIAMEFRSPLYSCAEECFDDFRDLRIDFENDRYELVYADLIEIPNFDDFSEEDKELGCAPQRNAYRLHGNLDEMREAPFRSTGTHFHFSSRYVENGPNLNSYTVQELRPIIRAFDKTIGLLDIVLFPETRRRNYYGMLGSYRKKPYGFEYRSPSGLVGLNPELVAFYARFMRSLMYYRLVAKVDEALSNEEVKDISRSGSRDHAYEAAKKVIKVIPQKEFRLTYYYEKLLETDIYLNDNVKKFTEGRQSSNGIEEFYIYHHNCYPRRKDARIARDVSTESPGRHAAGPQAESRA